MVLFLIVLASLLTVTVWPFWCLVDLSDFCVDLLLLIVLLCVCKDSLENKLQWKPQTWGDQEPVICMVKIGNLNANY